MKPMWPMWSDLCSGSWLVLYFKEFGVAEDFEVSVVYNIFVWLVFVHEDIKCNINFYYDIFTSCSQFFCWYVFVWQYLYMWRQLLLGYVFYIKTWYLSWFLYIYKTYMVLELKLVAIICFELRKKNHKHASRRYNLF